MNYYMKNSITKKNSFMFVTLNTQDGETIANNFLLLGKIKNSENMINPNLEVRLFSNRVVLIRILIMSKICVYRICDFS